MNILIHKLSPKIRILERNSSGTKYTPYSHVYTPFSQLDYLFLKKDISRANCIPCFQIHTPPVIGLSISILHPSFLLSCTSNVT